MIAGCPGSASPASEFTPEAYLIAVEDIATEVVSAACRSYLKGPGRQFAPSASELAERCRMMVPLERDPNDMRDMRNLTTFPIGAPVPEGMEPAGLVFIDFGRGKIDMTKLSHAEQEAVLRSHRIPDQIASDAVRPQIRRM